MNRKKKTAGNTLDNGTLVVNREYEELEKSGKLARVLKLRQERLKMVADWRAVWAEISRCNTQDWTDKFALRMLRNRKKVYENLQRHFDGLDSSKSKLVVRLKEIFEEIADLGGSVMTPMELATDEVADALSISDEHTGRKVGTPAQFRDRIIRMYRNLSNEQLCKRLDFELDWQDPPVGFPENWLAKYGVKNYSDAYKNPACKPLVQKLIAKAKQKL